MKTFCIYGCGGMGREIADLAFRMNRWEEIIFVDDNIKSRIIDEISVFTFDETLNQFKNQILNLLFLQENLLQENSYMKNLSSMH